MTQIQVAERNSSKSKSGIYSGALTQNFHLFGPYGKSEFTFAACTMAGDENSTGIEADREGQRPAWPAGNYCIYKTGAECPTGALLNYGTFIVSLLAIMRALCQSPFCSFNNVSI